MRKSCKAYIQKSKVATITIKSLRQPPYEKETNSFRISITTESEDLIAKVDDGVTFTPLRGKIQGVSVKPKINIVQDETKVDIIMSP